MSGGTTFILIVPIGRNVPPFKKRNKSHKELRGYIKHWLTESWYIYSIPDTDRQKSITVSGSYVNFVL